MMTSIGTGAGVGPGVGPGVGVGAQTATVIEFASNTTAPFLAKTLPSTVAPVFSVIDVNARMFPAKFVAVPSVAELPIYQKIWQA